MTLRRRWTVLACILLSLCACKPRPAAGTVETSSTSGVQAVTATPAASVSLSAGGTSAASTAAASTASVSVAATSAAPAPDPNAVYHPMSFASLGQRVPVFTYHDVILSRAQKDAVWFDCTSTEFEDQMRFLHDHGAHVITLDQLRDHLTRGTRLPDHAVALTFDDGYLGVYQYAFPVLKRYGYPATAFVHTDRVGQPGGRPKMTWAMLRELEASGLFQVESHTKTHPEDMGTLSVDQQDTELLASRAVIERELGHPVNYVAYPNGKGNATTFERARQDGYTLGFMEAWGPVEQSPDLLALNRYIHLQLERGWAETYGPDASPAAVVLKLDAHQPVAHRRVQDGRVTLELIQGGVPHSREVPGRQGVGDFVRQARAEAGVNGTFFVDASLHSFDGHMIGPVMNSDTPFVPDRDPRRLTAIGGRPLVLWGRRQVALLPFVGGQMSTLAPLRAFMPDVTDLFVAGAWLVHGGAALSEAAMAANATGDFRDIRPRVFLGFTRAGVPVIGASITPTSSMRLAQAVARAGVWEAVLLDSGYSTSLVYGSQILAVGHQTRRVKSRPVPHAIVLDAPLLATNPADDPAAALTR